MLNGKIFKKIKLEILFWLLKQEWYIWIMEKVAKIRFTTYYALPENSRHYKWGSLMWKGYAVLKPGDIILTADKNKLTTKVIGQATKDFGESKIDWIPGHAALCVSKNMKFEIAEMTHKNFTKSTWSDVCYESTRVVILRCNTVSKDFIENVVIPTCLSFENKKYDYSFVQGVDELLCSEIPFFSYKGKLDVKLDPILGMEPYISPAGLLNAKNCEIVWDSNKEV